LAHKAGFKVLGVEHGEESKSLIERQFGLPVRTGGIEALDGDRQFDVITMFHVLEHVADPARTLRNLKDRLTDDGLLVIEVPNIESWGFRWFGKGWRGLDLPRHVTHFSPQTLTGLLRRTGFEPVSVRRFTFRNSPALIASSITPSYLGRTKAGFRSHPVASLLRIAVQLGLYLMSLPVAFLEALCGRGEVILIAARKSGEAQVKTKESFGSKVGWVFGATVLGVGLMNLALLLIGRWLGPEAFGAYFVAFSIATFAVLPSAYGLGPAATYLLAREDGDGPLALASSVFLLFSIVFTAALWMFRSSIANAVGVAPNLVESGILFSLPLAGYLYLEQALKGLRRYRSLAGLRVTVPVGFLAVVAVMIFGFGQLDYTVPLWARALPYLAAAGLAFPILLMKLPALRLNGLGLFLRFAGGAMVGSAASVFFISADKLMLTGILSPAEIGIYSGYFLVSFMVAGRLSEIMTTVLFPESTRRNAEVGEDAAPHPRAMARTLAGFVGLFALLAVIQQVAIFILGDRFGLPWPLGLLFAFGGSLFGTAEMRWWYLASFGRRGIRLFALNSAAAVILLVAGMLTLAPIHGLWGAASALALAAGYNFIASLVCERHV